MNEWFFDYECICKFELFDCEFLFEVGEIMLMFKVCCIVVMDNYFEVIVLMYFKI